MANTATKKVNFYFSSYAVYIVKLLSLIFCGGPRARRKKGKAGKLGRICSAPEAKQLSDKIEFGMDRFIAN